MPRQLPGMYWDHERQRYFPLSSRPFSPPVATAQIKPVSIVVQRHCNPYHALSDLRSVLRSTRKDALVRQARSSQILLTDKVTRSIVSPVNQGSLSAFQVARHDGRLWSFAGDTLGWLYSSVVDGQTDSIDAWQRQFCLSSEISSIALSPTACVATTFGPECRVSYLPLDTPGEGIHVSRIDSRAVHDVWTTDLQGSRLVLGANKQVVVIEDIAFSTSLQHLPTKSDVFALAQRQSVLYAGLRNGSILQFDSRAQTSSSHPLLDGTSQRTSSVINLKNLHDYQLLVSSIDGGMLTYDLRFPFRTPTMEFTGNFNSYTVRLPLAIDPHEKFLFAAGQDKRVRLWSLVTGGPALCPEETGSVHQTVFQRPFEHHIAAMQVVEETEGMSLWAASGTELYKYSLGHRPGIEL